MDDVSKHIQRVGLLDHRPNQVDQKRGYHEDEEERHHLLKHEVDLPEAEHEHDGGRGEGDRPHLLGYVAEHGLHPRRHAQGISELKGRTDQEDRYPAENGEPAAELLARQA